MSACDQCGSYVYGPDVNFIRMTEEEKWDKNFPGALAVLAYHAPVLTCNLSRQARTSVV